MTTKTGKRNSRSEAGLAAIMEAMGDDPHALIGILVLMDEIVARRETRKSTSRR